jgi:hypothetical protein
MRPVLGGSTSDIYSEGSRREEGGRYEERGGEGFEETAEE